MENQIAGVDWADGQHATGAPATPGQSTGADHSNPPPQSGNPPAAITVARASTAPPPPFRNVEVRDINNDDVPDIWIYYHPQKPGEIVRQEEATTTMAASMPGAIFTMANWSGAMLIVAAAVARTPFITTKRIRLSVKERDEAGQGRMTYRASYQNGRIERVERTP